MGAVSAPEQTADLEQAPDPQTEVVEEAPQVDAAATEQVEAAAAEDEAPQLDTPPVKTYTEEEVAERQRIAAEQAARTVLEADRSRRQSENARQAQEADRKARERVRMRESVEAKLLRNGIDANDDLMDSIIDSVSGTRSELTQEALSQASESDVEVALSYLTAPWRGDTRPYEAWGLSTTQNAIASKMHAIYELGRQSAEASDEYVKKSELPKLYEAEIARRNAKAREGKTELTRVEGAPTSPVDRSLEAVTNRIISNSQDAEDEKLWNNRFRRQ